MIALNDLNKIGFGAYRVSIDSPENEKALLHAIKCGCNLIDTASNYGNGKSEKLIGKVLQQVKSDSVFVVTKAGYISHDNLSVLQALHKKGKGLIEVVDVSDELKHSIHPDYLEAQIETSLNRLNRTHIDGFLLHTPEYYFEGKDLVSTLEYYQRIKKAFEFLEGKVEKGIIRYYGVSSNTLTVHKNEPNSTDLNTLIDIANQVSTKNHFKLIQFPFNIIEQDAHILNHLGKSLIETAKEHHIKTLGNRPLNSNSPTGLLRLVIHDKAVLKTDITNDRSAYENAFHVIEKQLKEVDPEANISDISILVFLKDNWMKISNPDSFEKAFYELFYPFVNYIFDDEIPENVFKVLKEFESTAKKHHLKTQSDNVIDYFKTNHLNHLLTVSPQESLPYNLCREYLNTGIDHVLVGMKSPEYVDEFKGLFQNNLHQEL